MNRLSLRWIAGLFCAGLVAIGVHSAARATVVTWDANGTSTGQTDGAGAWLDVNNKWWNGSTNVVWNSGDDAIFGNGGTGGAVALASPTTVNSLTFNNFGGTYTLGTTGQTITLNNGITKNAGSGAVKIVSPLTFDGTQSWLNNSSTVLSIESTTNNNGFNLTVDGSGLTELRIGVISGSGGITKNGSGRLVLGGAGTPPAHTYSGDTVVNGGVLMCYNNLSPNSNLILNGGVYETYWTETFSRSLGTGPGQVQIIGGASGFSENGAAGMTVDIGGTTELVWGSAYFNPSAFVLQAPSAQAGSTLTFKDDLNLNGDTRTIAVNAKSQATWATITGVIRNTGTTPAGLIKTGPGLLILNAAAANTYDGGTTISAGTLRFLKKNLMPAVGEVAVQDGATLSVAVGGTGEWTTGLSGAGTIGGLLAGLGGQVGSTVTYSGNVNLGFHVSGAQTYSGDIADVGSSLGIVISNTGTMALTGNNSYTGQTIVLGGTLQFDSIANVGGGNSALGAPTAVANGTIGVGDRNTAGTLKYVGSGHTSDRVIDMRGAGAGATIDASGTGALVLTGNVIGTYFTTANGQANKTLTLSGTSTELNTMAGVINNNSNGTGTQSTALTKAGTGTWVLSGANTYNGTTTIQTGTLIVGTNAPSNANGAFGKATSDVIFGVAGGNTDAAILIGGQYTVGRNIRLASSNNTDNGTRTLTLGGSTADESTFSGAIHLGTASQTSRGIIVTAAAGGKVTFSGVIQNPTGQDTAEAAAAAAITAVTKTGDGVVVLSNNNTYTGSTAVNAGTLLVNGSLVNTASVAVNNSGTLGGTGSINGPVTVNDGGALAPGASVGQLTLNNGLDMSAGGTGANMVWELGTLSTDNPGLDFDFLSISVGDLVLGGQSKLTLDFSLLPASQRPDYATPDVFWTSNRSWKIIDTNSNPGNTNFTQLANAVFSVGTFSAVVGSGLDAGDIFLQYTAGSPGPVTRNWTGAELDGLWANPLNWAESSVPVAGQLAKFTVTGAGAVSIGTGATVGQVSFDSSTSYTVSGDTGATLTMDNTGGSGNASIAAVSGNHTISAQVASTAATPLDLSAATGATLNLTGGLLNAASEVNILEGTIIAAAIDGAGDTSVGTVSAAELVTEHIRQDALTIGSGSSVTISGTSGPGSTSIINLLQIFDGTDFVWSAGGGFTMTEAGEAGGGTQPVPEPGTWALCAIAVLGLPFILRRRS